MTHNQIRAIALAGDIRQGRIVAEKLPEIDWELLLLAADVNKPFAPPMLIATRVLERATRHVGYFGEDRQAHSSVAFRVRLKGDLVVDNRGKPYIAVGDSL